MTSADATPPFRCRICGCRDSYPPLPVREMMFGLRQTFDYFRCRSCDCLQIGRIPPDLDRFYPRDYYSNNPTGTTPESRFVHVLRTVRDRHALGRRGPLGAWLERRYPYPELRSLSRVPGLTRDRRILDVGSGEGTLLRRLHELGFRRLLGIDPYLACADPAVDPPVRRQTLAELPGEWDLIMFHHSFEHVRDPADTLVQAAERLAVGGSILLRMPIVPSWALERYGANWVQLDAPRHLHLHSRHSLEQLAAGAGMRIHSFVCDSNELQFWGSEQYERDIPLVSENSWAVNPEQSPFTHAEVAEFRRRAVDLNREGWGDQVATVLTR